MKKKEQKVEYSINELAEKIVGKRETLPGNFILFDQPAELGYHCPVCKYKRIVKGEFDERLHWSEYKGFIWCKKCDKDYPSALCEPDIDKAIETYLKCVLEVKQSVKGYYGKALNKKSSEGKEKSQVKTIKNTVAPNPPSPMQKKK